MSNLQWSIDIRSVGWVLEGVEARKRIKVREEPCSLHCGAGGAMDRQARTAFSPSLGATADEAWRAWRAQPYVMGSACYAVVTGASSVGEVTWQNDGLYRVLDEDGSRAKRLTNAQEDEVWEALVAGRLMIYRRRNSIGRQDSPKSKMVLHEAGGTPIPDGLVDEPRRGGEQGSAA